MNIFRQIIQYVHFQQFPTNLKNVRLRTLVGIGGICGISLIMVRKGVNENVPIIGSTVRFLRSAKIGLLISFDYHISKLGLNEGHPNYNAMISRIHQRAADRILEGCLINGGSYIKLGQGLVCMNHILPIEYTETLKQLQNKCLNRKPYELEQLFQEDFGKTPFEMYKSFIAEPIAAASLAQVYKAVTVDGEEVAVKVQYIDLDKRFKSDVKTIEILLKIIGMLHTDFNFAWILRDLKNSFRQELNFENEAKNAERCARDLKHLPFVYVPKIRRDLCSRRVLVAEFIDGYKITDVVQLKLNRFSLSDINTKLFKIFGEQIFQTGFVHADPHPGNVLIRRKDNKIQIVLLDHGLYETISEQDRLALSHLWKAIVFRDFQKMQEYSQQLGVKDYVLFAEMLTQAPLKTSNFKLKVKLTEDDLNYMKDYATNKFNNIMIVLRSMPTSLLLILRNLNSIRAISHEHGNPIDRYEILARCATKTAFDSKQSIVKKIWNVPLLFYFEIKLLSQKISTCLQKLYIRILYLFGGSTNVNILVDYIS